MVELIQIFCQAPRAILHGCLDVDHRTSVYGFPARLVGVLLLQIAVLAVADAIYWGINRGNCDWTPWYLVVRLVLFFGGIIGAGMICVLFRESRHHK